MCGDVQEPDSVVSTPEDVWLWSGFNLQLRTFILHAQLQEKKVRIEVCASVDTRKIPHKPPFFLGAPMIKAPWYVLMQQSHSYSMTTSLLGKYLERIPIKSIKASAWSSSTAHWSSRWFCKKKKNKSHSFVAYSLLWFTELCNCACIASWICVECALTQQISQLLSLLQAQLEMQRH